MFVYSFIINAYVMVKRIIIEFSAFLFLGVDILNIFYNLIAHIRHEHDGIYIVCMVFEIRINSENIR